MNQNSQRAPQNTSFNLNRLAVISLTLICIVPAFSVEAAQEEGKFIRTPVYENPNEIQPAFMPSTQPALPPNALESGLGRRVVDIGPEMYSFKYEEPGSIEEEGIFCGIRFSYTVHDLVPVSPEKSPSDRGMMYRAEGRLAFGQVDYDGALMDGTPYKVNNIDDFTFEGRFLLGADILYEETLGTLYSGIGYRYLNDDLSFDPAGYQRESNYFYVPFGYQFDSSHKAGWSFGFGAEFDIFIFGIQRSHLSDFDPALPDIDNDQNSGYGYRASIRFKNKSKDSVFVIEPFFRYWDIDDSEIEYDYYEPSNETTEIGIQLYWVF